MDEPPDLGGTDSAIPQFHWAEAEAACDDAHSAIISGAHYASATTQITHTLTLLETLLETVSPDFIHLRVRMPHHAFQQPQPKFQRPH